MKFNSPLEVPYGQNLEPKPPQSEPQLQPYQLMKRYQQVSKCNGCGTLTNSIKKICGTEKLQAPLNNTK